MWWYHGSIWCYVLSSLIGENKSVARNVLRMDGMRRWMHVDDLILVA